MAQTAKRRRNFRTPFLTRLFVSLIKRGPKVYTGAVSVLRTAYQAADMLMAAVFDPLPSSAPRPATTIAAAAATTTTVFFSRYITPSKPEVVGVAVAGERLLREQGAALSIGR